MFHLLLVSFRFIGRNLFLFVLIVFGLYAAPKIREEWRAIEGFKRQLPALQDARQEFILAGDSLADATVQQVRQLSRQTVQTLDAQIRVLDTELGKLRREQAQQSSLAAAIADPDSMAQRLRAAALRELKIELLRQEREYLVTLRPTVLALNGRNAAKRRLTQLGAAHGAAFAAVQRVTLQTRQVCDNNVLVLVPGTTWKQQCDALQKAQRELIAANNRVSQAWQAQNRLLGRWPTLAPMPEFEVDGQRLASAGAALEGRIKHAEDMLGKSLIWQAYQAVQPVLFTALTILLAWLLAPPALRAVCYFVLAPLAARRPPIVIASNRHGMAATLDTPRPALSDSARISAVSRQVTLQPGHELLVRTHYCQSQSTGIRITTQFLFSGRHWLTSIAAQLWMLTRVRTTQEAQITVSSMVDALEEVALIEIGPGQAFVLQPRGLVGVLYKSGQRPVIRSHWRLGTLHAWLTLQLRYLAFEGPATLIVKGCRGVRLESAAGGRSVSQEATLGFSTNARYATVRAEPFTPYVRGMQPLFHDRFEGNDAWFLYEEVPRNVQGGQRKNNPVGMLFDVTLKAFGV